MLALIRFTVAYCHLKWNSRLRQLAQLVLILDIISLALNPVLGHAFTVEAITVEGRDYYRLIPFFAQNIHNSREHRAVPLGQCPSRKGAGQHDSAHSGK